MKTRNNLAEVAKQIGDGDTDSLPTSISLNLQSLSEEDFRALIELARYRSFGHRIFRDESLAKKANVRNLINTGNFEAARAELNGTSKTDDPELLLSKARIEIFEGRFREGAVILENALDHPGITPVSRGVAFQMKAHALMEQGALAEAGMHLETAINIAAAVGNGIGRAAALLLLAKVRAFEGAREPAQKALSSGLENIVSVNATFRWVLGYFRTQSHVSLLFGDPVCRSHALAAVFVARALGDRLYVARGRAEILLMERALGNPPLSSEFTDIALIREEAVNNPGFDLGHWLQAIETGQAPAGASQTLRRFMELASSGPASSLMPPVCKDVEWIYDSHGGLLIDLSGGSYLRLPKESSPVRLLRTLHGESASIQVEDVFEKIWNLRWNADRHESTLKKTLSRFNQLASKEPKVVRKDNKLSLSSPGLFY
jgi:tetratricopeptide (TPR) repeat protein